MNAATIESQAKTTQCSKNFGRGHGVSHAGLPIEQVLGEHSLSSQRCSYIKLHQSPGWLLRSGARASDSFSDYPKYKTPTLLYETHPNYLNTDNLKAFRDRILTVSHILLILFSFVVFVKSGIKATIIPPLSFPSSLLYY